MHQVVPHLRRLQMPKKTKHSPKPVTPQEAKQMIDWLDDVIIDFDGDIHDLQRALGTYILGRHTGWRYLALVHNKRTIRKHEEILGISIREEFEEEGPGAMRSPAYKLAKTLSNFWKAVSGEVSVGERGAFEKG